MAQTKNVAVLIYPGVEVIDMNGPIEVYIKANRLNSNRYKAFTIAETDGIIKSEKVSHLIYPHIYA